MELPRRFSARDVVARKNDKGAKFMNQIPNDLIENPELQKRISALPENYNFEILKTVWRLKQTKAKNVALQFPEGLLMYSLLIVDILKQYSPNEDIILYTSHNLMCCRFGGVENCFVLGDVTYGACCVDDFTAKALGCEFLVHYGHSCLIPVDVTALPCLYIFVTIEINMQNFVDTIRHNFPKTSHIALAGTIQFSTAVHNAKELLIEEYAQVTVPQIRPLSPGEVLGCTAPKLPDSVDCLVFVADGRFHLEAIMIANPQISAFRYDPYSTILTKEEYAHETMRKQRQQAIKTATSAQRWGIILSSLGRQGNPTIVKKVKTLAVKNNKHVFTFIISEIQPVKVQKIGHIEAWVQVGCPRLSIDWGDEFGKPVLTPYEAYVALNAVPAFWKSEKNKESGYPMDYYAKESGPWSSCYHKNRTINKNKNRTMV